MALQKLTTMKVPVMSHCFLVKLGMNLDAMMMMFLVDLAKDFQGLDMVCSMVRWFDHDFIDLVVYYVRIWLLLLLFPSAITWFTHCSSSLSCPRRQGQRRRRQQPQRCRWRPCHTVLCRRDLNENDELRLILHSTQWWWGFSPNINWPKTDTKTLYPSTEFHF